MAIYRFSQWRPSAILELFYHHMRPPTKSLLLAAAACQILCVGVCACVSVTLSVNSPTGQTHQRIFTVDSLKDADLRKDVPFGGLDDE